MISRRNAQQYMLRHLKTARMLAGRQFVPSTAVQRLLGPQAGSRLYSQAANEVSQDNKIRNIGIIAHIDAVCRKSLLNGNYLTISSRAKPLLQSECFTTVV